jgi:hypothetical protein
MKYRHVFDDPKSFKPVVVCPVCKKLDPELKLLMLLDRVIIPPGKNIEPQAGDHVTLAGAAHHDELLKFQKNYGEENETSTPEKL